MKKISLTKMIILGLILGMIAGVIINNITSAETAKAYAGEISIFTTIFLRLIKMVIAPLVISTLVVGIAKMGDAKTLGRIFSKTFFLFICASLLSIALGLVMVNLFQPGVGINFVPYDTGAVAAVQSEPFTLKVFISHAVPTSIVDAMAHNAILQIVVFSIFLGCSLAAIGEKAEPIVKVLDSLVYVMLKLTGYVMLFAPLTVFAAISGLIAERGLGVMVSAGIFMGEFYLTLGMLWAILIGLSVMIVGPCISRLTRMISEPALLAFSTASSEAAFPGTLNQLEKFGVSPKIASFVLPIGYSFNLVGSMAYCSFATVFIAQACNVHLSMGEQITMLLILMLTSKGMAGVPRASMVVIAATLSQFNIPEAGLILLMGVDPFLDMGRSATNVMSNAMGAAIVSRWEGEHFGAGCRGKAPGKVTEQGQPAHEPSEGTMS
ncbi:dicarboxylate/amino acid:cation symporter [Salmonella enterica subsp. enterica serovar Louisiana]|uniref:Dicarboxylate/amino acid:cation symporter n=4 Tax=Salmonella enterica TaxID=28901 RepID=A0A744BHM4_SALER|nr:dicarboxylate/amino acid:cation symporter [Salmonella enterica]EAA5488321.1 dicarboxylate/amino acid:cation symporter [Salmonella enterica subsp. enterica serovar Kouka]EBG0215081.1 dicarboxylate/amino acid:cation symporter [Salmonella enterica subsp. enterica serovar Louisiana]EBG2396522.1 dicarboxylate/amino acid:cation symporter [Salmonella enterica subsp. enterica serovar Everleigh]EBS5459480.1 dicarboxylate/amino acid:cation symporter [Salmonella enterica subsp. enterica serovar Enterit